MRPNIPCPVVLAATIALSMLTALPCLASPQAKLLEERKFRLIKDGRDQVILSVPTAGMLVVRARVKEPFPTAPLHLLLEGPDGLRVEKTGAAPLRLRYALPASAAGETWRASVINVSKLPNVLGKLTVEILPAQHRAEGSAASVPSADEVVPGVIDGKVKIVDDLRLRAVCRDRNRDVSVRLDLEQGTGELLMRFNHAFSLEVRQVSDERIEMRGSGDHPLYLDLAGKAIVFASGEKSTFCRVRIYRAVKD